MSLRLHEDVLVYESWKSMPLMKIPVMTTAIRTSRGIVLIAPGKETAHHEAQLEQFGRVTDIVAPNLYHHESIHMAQKAFPQATIWGVEGLRAKRPDVAWDKVLTTDNWHYGDEIEIKEIKGTKLNEMVFFHPKSKTLVVTDLFFNLLHPKGLGAWIILSIFGTYKKFGISSFYMRGVHNLEEFKSSLKEILKFDFQTIVMAHGEPLQQDVRVTVERALRERDLL